MITSAGNYRVTVSESNNPTYLHGGEYAVTIEKPRKDKTLVRAYARFVNVATGSGTFERVAMLNVFELQKRVICEKV